MSARLVGIDCVACPHVLQAYDGPDIRRLETCARALGTCVSSYTGRPARLFFMLEARDPQGATEHVAALELTSAERRGPES
jgi:hypothetical protein